MAFCDTITEDAKTVLMPTSFAKRLLESQDPVVTGPDGVKALSIAEAAEIRRKGSPVGLTG